MHTTAIKYQNPISKIKYIRQIKNTTVTKSSSVSLFICILSDTNYYSFYISRRPSSLSIYSGFSAMYSSQSNLDSAIICDILDAAIPVYIIKC